MKTKYFSLKYLVIGIVCQIAFNSCAYDDYVKSYNYSAVYFGSQKPLRTLVARQDSVNLTFKLGVVLSGLLVNPKDQWVTFEIAPDLLTSVAGASGYTLLPTDWYKTSLLENKIIIPKGNFMGDFSIYINKAKFASDSLSLTKKYALPVRLLKTSADSILMGSADGVTAAKNYTIVVIKYISEKSGTYYVRGQQSQLNSVGDTIAGTTIKYYKSDWSQNKTRVLTTLSLTKESVAGVGANTTDYMTATFGTNNSISLSTSSLSPTVIVTDLGSSFDQTQGVYLLNYKYIKSGITYKVVESLKLRQDPELDLRFEEW